MRIAPGVSGHPFERPLQNSTTSRLFLRPGITNLLQEAAKRIYCIQGSGMEEAPTRHTDHGQADLLNKLKFWKLRLSHILADGFPATLWILNVNAPEMSLSALLFKTSVGQKFIMAITGLILILFIIGHLAGNLQIFAPPEQINAYAHGLAELAPIVWVVRFILLVSIILHIWMAVLLTVENRRARPQNYDTWKSVQATYAARTMRMSGFIVFAFVLFHLAHFTFLWINPEYANMTFTLEPGVEVLDVHLMMVAGFSNLWVSLFYIIAIGLLSMHVAHGLSSLFQSIGWRNANWAKGLEKTSYGFAIAYFALNAIIPIAVLAGFVTR